MKITLCNKATHEELSTTQKEHPNITFQNVGYQYIEKSKLTKADNDALDRINEILKEHVEGFSKFFNFKIRVSGDIVMRFNYAYDEYFTGIGYLGIDELLKGFKDNQSQG